MDNVTPLRPVSDRTSNLNVLGEPMDVCSCEPMTGWFRDGKCRTDERDHGHHVVCVVMTAEFLKYSKKQGNDLSTPMPHFGFEGLKAGDHWCLCCTRWREAYEEGSAPLVNLKATHMSALSVVSLDQLKQHSHLLN